MNQSELVLQRVEQEFEGTETEFFDNVCLTQAIAMLRVAQGVLVTTDYQVVLVFSAADEADVNEMEEALYDRFGFENVQSMITVNLLSLLPTWYAVNADQITAGIIE